MERNRAIIVLDGRLYRRYRSWAVTVRREPPIMFIDATIPDLRPPTGDLRIETDAEVVACGVDVPRSCFGRRRSGRRVLHIRSASDELFVRSIRLATGELVAIEEYFPVHDGEESRAAGREGDG